MEELVKTFHIDFGLILAQMVNFVIVLLVLYKFAYKPILKVLNERTNKIEKGLKDAEKAQKELADIDVKKEEFFAEAKKESQKIMAVAEDNASKQRAEILKEAKIQAEGILQEAKRRIEDEKNKTLKEIRSEVSDMVVLATEKFLSQKMNAQEEKKIIEKIIEN